MAFSATSLGSDKLLVEGWSSKTLEVLKGRQRDLLRQGEEEQPETSRENSALQED